MAIVAILANGLPDGGMPTIYFDEKSLRHVYELVVVVAMDESSLQGGRYLSIAFRIKVK